MSRIIASLVLALATIGPAHAQGDAAAGQAKAAICGACHGPDGNSLIPAFPSLAGQGERYLIEQLQDIRSGRRQVPEMTGLLTSLSDQDLADLAALYAEQKSRAGPDAPDIPALGQTLFHGGRLDSGLPACAGCHLPSGMGIAAAGFPRLSGQRAQYVIRQLVEFRSGRRTTDGDTQVMRSIAARLDDADIEALGAYIETLR